MQQLLKQIPIPLSGLMLGLFSLAKLALIMDQKAVQILFLALGVTTWILLVAKFVFTFTETMEQLKNPVVASVAPTFTMGTMVFTSMFITHFEWIKIIWLLAFALQIVLVCYFVKTFIFTKAFQLQSVLPSWFIVFVGLGIGPVTAGDIFPTLTHIVFWIVLTCYVILLPTVLVRLKKHALVEPTKPLVAILSAPGSLLFVGYMQTFTNINDYLLIVLFTCSQLFYLVVLSLMPKLLKLPFYPSYAALTFPLIISATAVEKMYLYTGNPFFQAVGYLEFIIGIFIVLYVYVRYTRFLRKTYVQTVSVTSKA